MNLHLLTADATDVISDIQYVKHFTGLYGGAEAKLDSLVGGLVDKAIFTLESNQFQKSQIVKVPISSKIGSRNLLVLGLGDINRFSLSGLQNAIEFATKESIKLGFKTIATPVIGIAIGLPVEQAYRTVVFTLISSFINHISENRTMPCIEDFIIFDRDQEKVLCFIDSTQAILSELKVDYRQISSSNFYISLESLLQAKTKVRSESNRTMISFSKQESHSGGGIITPNVIKVLFLSSNPQNTQPLRLDEEIREIDTAFRQSDYRNRFDIRQQWAVRVIDLQNHLLRHKPDIVHFSGHGSLESRIILENTSGQSHQVPSHALSKLFSVLKDNIKCVVLNACYSEDQAQAIAENIDCVIGMSKAVGDKAAISFATAFYSALGYGRDVKTAFELGCVQIEIEDLKEEDTPKLIAKHVDPSQITFIRD